MEFYLKIFVSVSFLYVCQCKYTVDNPTHILDPQQECSGVLWESLKLEIRNHKPNVNRILKELNSPSFQNRTYKDMADFVDEIGPRPSGSNGEKHAIKYMARAFQNVGLENIRQESVTVPRVTQRRKEYVKMIEPRRAIIAVIGDRWSLGTSVLGIVAEAFVIGTLKELISNRAQVLGKIIVFYNVNPKNYELDADLRNNVVTNATKFGAVAVLASSLTDFSLYTLHQGRAPLPQTSKIPSGAITLEDAQLLYRISRRNEKIVLRVVIGDYALTNTTTHNLIGDYKGTTKPNEFVSISGHLDNVEFGLGAQDDGVGLFLSLNTIRLLKQANIRAKRTIKAVLFTSEEPGYFGSLQFYSVHANEIQKGSYKVALEADSGCIGGPNGWSATSPTLFQCTLSEIMTMYFQSGEIAVGIGSTDVKNAGVPAADLDGNKNGRYMWYHHTSADTMTAVNARDLDECLAVYSVTTYILADLENTPY